MTATTRRAALMAALVLAVIASACASSPTAPVAPALDYGSCTDSIQVAEASAYGGRGMTQRQVAPRDVLWRWAMQFDGYHYSAWYVSLDGRAAPCVVTVGYVDSTP